MEDTRGRALLAVVPSIAPEPVQTVAFCSHCASRPIQAEISNTTSRVCESCGLGLLLEAAADAAPGEGGAFLVLDGSLSVCAVSHGAEELLATREIDAVHRHITELLIPADAETQSRENLAVAVTWAARGHDPGRTVTVRPTNTFGVRLRARISSCGPARAALLVFD